MPKHAKSTKVARDEGMIAGIRKTLQDTTSWEEAAQANQGNDLNGPIDRDRHLANHLKRDVND
jgi:hypothetical protein